MSTCTRASCRCSTRRKDRAPSGDEQHLHRQIPALIDVEPVKSKLPSCAPCRRAARGDYFLGVLDDPMSKGWRPCVGSSLVLSVPSSRWDGPIIPSHSQGYSPIRDEYPYPTCRWPGSGEGRRAESRRPMSHRKSLIPRNSPVGTVQAGTPCRWPRKSRPSFF